MEENSSEGKTVALNGLLEIIFCLRSVICSSRCFAEVSVKLAASCQFTVQSETGRGRVTQLWRAAKSIVSDVHRLVPTQTEWVKVKENDGEIRNVMRNDWSVNMSTFNRPLRLGMSNPEEHAFASWFLCNRSSVWELQMCRSPHIVNYLLLAQISVTPSAFSVKFPCTALRLSSVCCRFV